MSYTLKYTGTQIDDILDRAAPNGEFDGYFYDINDKLDKLNIVTTSDDYATVQAYIQNNVAVAFSDGGKFYVYAGQYDGNYYFACVTQGSSDTTDAVYEVAYIDSGDNWSVGNGSALAPLASPNFTGNPTAPTKAQSDNSTKIATTAYVRTAVDPVSSAALNAYPTDTVSGDVVSISDGASNIPVKAFTGSIIPAQDLNGQSAPYPSGGGKNKLQITATTQTINGVTITVNADGSIKVNGTTTAQTIIAISDLLTPLATGNPVILNGCPSGGSTSTYCLDTGYNAYVDSGSGVTLGDAQLSGQRVRLRLASGQTFSNLMFYPMIRLATEADATFAPYSNVCPISGWTGANIYRAGENATPTLPQIVQGAINAGDGSNLNSAYRVRTYFIPVEPSTTYSIYTNVEYMYTFEYSSVNLASFIKSSGWTRGIKTITTDANTHQLRLALAHSSTSSGSGAIEIVPSEITQIVVSPTIDTILLDFGTTVYGGSFDATTGVLTIDWAKVTLTGVGGTWGKSTSYPGSYYISASSLGFLAKSAGGELKCSHLEYTPVIDSTHYVVGKCALDNSVNLYLGDASQFPSTSDFTAYLAAQYAAGTPVEIVGKTWATTVQLDPVTLKTLLGANTVWTDVGSVTGMTYRADTALYVQKLLNGGGSLSLSMAAPSPSLSLGRVGVLAEPEEAEPEQIEEETEQTEQTEEPEQTEEAEEA